MKYIQLIYTAAVVFLIVSISSAWAAEFRADMLEEKAGKRTQKSKLYVKDAQYRMTMEEDELKLYLIVDEGSGTTTVLSPEHKEYRQVENNFFHSMSGNPVQSFYYHAEKYDRRELERETFKGYDCTKVLVQAGERKLYTAWISEELGFPLKILFHLGDGMSMELDNIKQGPVDPSVFTVPEGYTFREQ